MEILTGQPAPGVFVSPKTAEGNCMQGLASAGSPAIVTGDLEELQAHLTDGHSCLRGLL